MMKQSPMTQLEKLKLLRAQRLSAEKTKPTPVTNKSLNSRKEAAKVKQLRKLLWDRYMAMPAGAERDQFGRQFGWVR
jgi:hypothetical protein